jgi:hypothetical protein
MSNIQKSATIGVVKRKNGVRHNSKPLGQSRPQEIKTDTYLEDQPSLESPVVAAAVFKRQIDRAR